jgi:hypothetical protein
MTTLHKILFLAICCLLVLVGVPPAHGQDSVGVWSQNLTNSTRVYAMDISASNGNLIYCAGLDSGVYRTTNGGVSWAAVNTGLTYNKVQTIAMSQSNNNILYCGTDQLGTTNSGVYKTTDGGATWTFASTGILETSRGIQAIVIHPTNPDIAWMSVFDGLVNSTTGLYKTTDGGANWVPSNAGIGTIKNILAIAANPLNPNTLYCGTSFSVVAPALRSRVYRSVDGGINWVDMSTGLPTDTTIGHPIRALSISTADTNVILAALFLAADTMGGAYVTTNGGTTWVRKHSGLQNINGALLRACLIKPGSSSEFYVGLDAGTATARGVWRTTNGGTSWSDFNNGTMANTYTIRALVFKRQGNPTLYAGAANAAVAAAGRGVYEYSWAGPLVLLANPGPANNGLSTGAAMFFNLIAGPRRVTVTDMTTANNAAANASFTVQFFTRSGNALGGPVGSGPGSSSAGWTSVGTVPVTQGSVASGVSLLFATPNISINPGDTVGVAMQFTGAGPRYVGQGTPPYETYSDANVTLVTGDGRSAPFTPTGSWFASRALVGEIHYTTTTVGVEEPGQEIPGTFELLQNYPNPFNPTTTIQFGLPVATNVTLRIYNVLGQEVVTLFDGQRGAGTFQAVWNGRNAAGNQVASGMYFYSLVARSANNAMTYTNIKKMLFLK